MDMTRRPSDYMKGTAPYSGKADTFATANVPINLPSNPAPYKGGCPGEPMIHGHGYGKADIMGVTDFKNNAPCSCDKPGKVDGTV